MARGVHTAIVAGWMAVARLAACAVVTLPQAALAAQTVPVPVPVPVTAARLPSREEIAPRPIAEEPGKQPSRRIRGSVGLPTAACPLRDSEVMVDIGRVAFETAGGAPVDPRLAAVLAPLSTVTVREQPIWVVCAIRDNIDATLREAGYIASAQIPPQEIEHGTIRFVIVTAHITEVRITGDVGGYRDIVTAFAAQLKQLDPLNQQAAERILLAANDLPGLRMRLGLRPAGTGPGEVIGELHVETQTASAYANVNNSGSTQLGPVIATARGEVYNLLGLADRAFVSFSHSPADNEVSALQAGYDVRLTRSGVRLAVQATRAISNPAIPILGAHGRAMIYAASVDIPLRRTLTSRLDLSLGGEVIDQLQTVLSSSSGTHDRLSVAFARFSGSQAIRNQQGDEMWHGDFSLELRRGTGLLGAMDLGAMIGGLYPSRSRGDPRATVVRAELVQTVNPVRPLSLQLSAFGQWADAPLLNYEEFALGNLTYGRGYDPGANGGDRAIAARFEPVWHAGTGEKLLIATES